MNVVTDLGERIREYLDVSNSAAEAAYRLAIDAERRAIITAVRGQARASCDAARARDKESIDGA